MYRKATAIVAVMLAFVLSPAFGQGAAKPAMKLSSTKWDFGRIEAGQTPTKIIEIHNTGTAELKITRIRSSCTSCLGHMSGARTIAPGKTGKITLSFLSKGLIGPQSKTIYIHSNDPAHAFLKVAISGTVTQPNGPRLTPNIEVVDFGLLPLNQNAVRAVTLTNTGKAPLTIKTVNASAGYTITSYPKKPIPSGKTGTIKVSLSARREKGLIQGFITIESSDPTAPTQTLAIAGYATGATGVKASPTGIHIRPSGTPIRIPGNPLQYQRTYEVTNNLPVAVTVTLPGKATPTTLAPGETATITIPTPEGDNPVASVGVALPALLPVPKP